MFKDRLKSLRKSKGVTQEELAQAIGVERSSIGKYEGSKPVMPSQEIVAALADFFNVSIDYLMDRTDDSTPPSKKTDDDFSNLRFALMTEVDHLDEEDLEDVINFAKFVREQKKKKK